MAKATDAQNIIFRSSIKYQERRRVDAQHYESIELNREIQDVWDFTKIEKK